jgi:N-acetylglucosaminyldiphosphoundecaprenol N-acetyl-beta-D-mannosaminyltransferase
MTAPHTRASSEMAQMFAFKNNLSARAVGGGYFSSTRPLTAVPPTLVEIDGYPVNVRDQAHAVKSIIERLSHPGSFLVCTLNLDHLVKLRKSSKLRDAYTRAEIVTADGFPIVTLGGLLGCELRRTTGADLIEPLCAAAALRRLPIFLMGTTFAVLSKSARRLKASYPDLEIAGVYAPCQNFAVQSAAADEAVDLIERSGARLCFLALGAPLQELFGLRAIDEMSGVVAFLTIGAGLDFLAGAQVRCPPHLQKIKLEWAWRLTRDPHRLWLRYFQCARLFTKLLIKESISRLAGQKRARRVFHERK